MHEHQQQQGNNLRLSYNIATLVALCLSRPAELALHYRLGRHSAMPIVRFLAPATPLIWAMIWAEKLRGQRHISGQDDLLLLTQLSYWIAGLMALHRLHGLILPAAVWSIYAGIPWLIRLVPFLGELFVKHWLEPALLIGGGYWAYTHGFNRPLSSYVVACGVALFVVGRQRAMQAEFEDIVLSDAFAAGEWEAERVRRISGR